MLLNDFVFARQDICPIDLQPANLKPQFRPILEVIVYVGVVQQNLRRNASDMQTSASEKRVLLHDDGLQSKFASPDRRHIPSRTAPDNRHIILCHS